MAQWLLAIDLCRNHRCRVGQFEGFHRAVFDQSIRLGEYSYFDFTAARSCVLDAAQSPVLVRHALESLEKDVVRPKALPVMAERRYCVTPRIVEGDLRLSYWDSLWCDSRFQSQRNSELWRPVQLPEG